MWYGMYDELLYNTGVLIFVWVYAIEIIKNSQKQVKVGAVALIRHWWDHYANSAFQNNEKLVAHLPIFAKSHGILIHFHSHLSINFVHCLKAVCSTLILITYVMQEFIFSHEVFMH